MEYDSNDYYSSSGEDEPPKGVEKKNKETKVPAKRKMTEAKLAQLKRAREAKARKRAERTQKPAPAQHQHQHQHPHHGHSCHQPARLKWKSWRSKHPSVRKRRRSVSSYNNLNPLNRRSQITR